MFSLINGVKGISAIVGVLLIMVVAIVGALVIYHSSTGFLSSSLTASSAKGLIIIEAVRVSDGMLVLMVRNIGNAKVIVDRVSIDKDGMTLYMLEVVGDGVAIKPGEVAEVKAKLPDEIPGSYYTIRAFTKSGG